MASLLSTALGVENMPPEIAAWLKTPQRADAFAASIVEKCRWLALPKAKRADVVADWALRIQVDAVADRHREWFSLTKEKRNEVIAKYEKAIENAACLGTWWLDDQPVINKAVRANWLELTLGERQAFIEKTMRGSGSRLENEERETHIADAMRLGWLRLEPEKQADLITKAFREWWSDLSAAERNALAISQVDDLRASIATEIYLAWNAHVESGTPIRAALLTATACALALARWTEEGRPFPVRAIREPLGLPGYNELPKFLLAARLSTDPTLTDAQIAKFVSDDLATDPSPSDVRSSKPAVAKRPLSERSIGNWRSDMSRFAHADAKCDLFFPLGFDAIPDDPTMTPEAIEAECAMIARRVAYERWERAQPKENERGDVGYGDRRRIIEEIGIADRTFLFRAALQITLHGRPVPDEFLEALVAVFGLRTTSTRARHHLSSIVPQAVGLPSDDHDMAAFRAAAAHDAAALRTHVAATVSDSDLKKFAAKVDELLADGWLTTPRRAEVSVSELAAMTDHERDTVRRWRAKPEYRRLVRTFALMPVLSADYWKRQHG